jgi:hypothetical protein
LLALLLLLLRLGPLRQVSLRRANSSAPRRPRLRRPLRNLLQLHRPLQYRRSLLLRRLVPRQLRQPRKHHLRRPSCQVSLLHRANL